MQSRSRLRLLASLFLLLASFDIASGSSDLLKRIIHEGRKCNMPSEPYHRYTIRSDEVAGLLTIGSRVELSSPINRTLVTAVVMKNAQEFIALPLQTRLRLGATGSIKVVCGERPCFIERWGNDPARVLSLGYLIFCYEDTDVENLTVLLNELREEMK